MSVPDRPNLLAYGDNLDVLRRHVPSESVDLVYLDPPFNSQADYNVLFAQKDGTPAAAQIKAFGDTWRWDDAAVAAYSEVVEAGGDASRTMQAFRTILGPSDMLAYLSMMAPRLIELRRVLRQTGSLYLHCDPTASHYLKVLLDAIFQAGNFQNEVIWYYKGAGISPRRWGRRHDVLFWFGKGPTPYFDPDSVRDPYAETTKARFAHAIGNKRGKNDYGQQTLNPAGKHPDDVWQLPILAPSARERLGYPTQKPESLLARIIKSSSKPNDVVLDPFCGCGTTVAAAQRLGRRWIGIDVTHHAIGLIKHRLETEYGPDVVASYQTIGEPTTIEDAAILAKEDPYQFQSWSLGLVGARNPIKIGGDGGIDGQSYFHDFDGGATRRIVYSVKGGHLVPAFVRDLRGVLEREDAEIAVLISMAEPTAGMRAEATEAGSYQTAAGRFPRLQLRTVRELLAGRGVDRPTGRKMTAAEYEQAALFADAEIPVAHRKPRRPAGRRPSAPAARSLVPIDTSAAARLRTDYSDVAGSGQSPAEPRPPRTPKRDRTGPLPSPGSGDLD